MVDSSPAAKDPLYAAVSDTDTNNLGLDGGFFPCGEGSTLRYWRVLRRRLGDHAGGNDADLV